MIERLESKGIGEKEIERIVKDVSFNNVIRVWKGVEDVAAAQACFHGDIGDVVMSVTIDVVANISLHG